MAPQGIGSSPIGWVSLCVQEKKNRRDEMWMPLGPMRRCARRDEGMYCARDGDVSCMSSSQWLGIPMDGCVVAFDFNGVTWVKESRRYYLTINISVIPLFTLGNLISMLWE